MEVLQEIKHRTVIQFGYVTPGNPCLYAKSYMHIHSHCEILTMVKIWNQVKCPLS